MPFKQRPRPTHFNCTSATAARALFVDRDQTPNIQLTFTTDQGEIIEFELTARECAKMLEQAISAYNAILPPLKTSRGGYGL